MVDQGSVGTLLSLGTCSLRRICNYLACVADLFRPAGIRVPEGVTRRLHLCRCDWLVANAGDERILLARVDRPRSESKRRECHAYGRVSGVPRPRGPLALR